MLVHASPMAGHLGVNKTYEKILTHFYWPKLRKAWCHSLLQDVSHLSSNGQTKSAAAMKPIPVCVESFNDIQYSSTVWGPLPKTKSGNKFLFTIMCAFSRGYSPPQH